MRFEDDMIVEQDETNMADVDSQDAEMIDEQSTAERASCVLSVTNVPVALFQDDSLKVSINLNKILVKNAIQFIA